VAGPHTRLRFVTEGVLTRRLISDPYLQGVECCSTGRVPRTPSRRRSRSGLIEALARQTA
jgi:hypothetical protein